MTERYIALDTETTGIGPKYHRLIEIAALEFDPRTGEPTGNHFHTYLNPQRDVPEESVKVHGKTLDDLKDAPLFRDVAGQLLDFIEGAHVVIHNAPFDVGFLDSELKQAKYTKLEAKVGSITDTCALSRRHVRAKRHNLDALCDRYSVDRTKRTLHGALIDCEMLARVYPPLLQEVSVTRARLNSLLPFELDAPLSDEVEDLVYRHLVIEELKKVLESDQKRYSEAIKELVQGSDIEGDFYTVMFQNRSTTNWEKVMKEHLPELDLAPYKSASSAMYIRHK